VAFIGYRDAIRVEAEENQDYAIGEIYSIGVDGKGLRRLTDNKAIETSPAWDPSGNRIAYVEAKPDHSWISGLANLFATGNRIREMNADGTCGQTVRSVPKVGLYGVAWRPGGPADGPIGC
jgi:Tol biopolymer transport system component